jgi:molybdate transport system regulatory protein
MAGYPGLLLRVLSSKNPAMGPGKARLIALIAESGSISAAARKMGMSYRRAWQLVEALNKSFNEPVVLTAVGGRRGGGAVVTDFGRRLVGAYHDMEAKASSAIAADLETYSGYLKKPGRRKKALR